jgi:hypothetical protein
MKKMSCDGVSAWMNPFDYVTKIGYFVNCAREIYYVLKICYECVLDCATEIDYECVLDCATEIDYYGVLDCATEIDYDGVLD